jgi:hypothetical protein
MTVTLEITDNKILKSYDPEYIKKMFEIFLKYWLYETGKDSEMF